MSDTKVPAPALFSETFEKARRNTLVWSGLAVAAELAQTKDHKFKTAIIGGDAALPVAMVSLIFILLSAFHLYAFWVEKRRIERWHSNFVREHSSESIIARIDRLYGEIHRATLHIDKHAVSLLTPPTSAISLVHGLNSQSSALFRHMIRTRSRDNQILDIINSEDSASEIKLKSIHNLMLDGEPYNNFIDIDFSPLLKILGRYVGAITSEAPGTGELHKKLDNITKDLKTLAADIDSFEKIHFRWYEVAFPFAAFGVATLLWSAARWRPDLPLRVVASFG